MDFVYAINPYGKKPILQINKHIGYDEEDGQGIDGLQFSREFLELDCLSPVLITSFINTMGGDVQQGFDIFNSIVEAKSKTRSVYQGFAYSTGGWCGMGADVVDAYDYSTWMCHLPYNPEEPNGSSPFLERVANSIATVISEKSGKNGKPKKSKEDILAMMRIKTYYTAEDLYNEGLIDNVFTSSGVVKTWNTGKETYKEYQKVLNKYINDNFKIDNIMSFVKVVNRLNSFKAVNIATLTEDADEASIVSTISRIENEFNVINKEKETLENKVKVLNESQEENQKKLHEAQNALNTLDSDYKNKESEIAKMKNEMEAMDAMNKELKTKEEEALNKAKEQEVLNTKERAVNLVKPFIGTKIKEDDLASIAAWENQAISNFEGTKLILESLPTAFKAPVTVSTVDALNSGNTRLEHYMAVNKEKDSERQARNQEELKRALTEAASKK